MILKRTHIAVVAIFIILLMTISQSCRNSKSEEKWVCTWTDYPGGHVFSVWRNHLNYIAPMLFR